MCASAWAGGGDMCVPCMSCQLYTSEAAAEQTATGEHHAKHLHNDQLSRRGGVGCVPLLGLVAETC